MPHSGPLVQREPGGRCLLTGSGWSKPLLPCSGAGPQEASLQRLQEGCHNTWWPRDTGHTAAPGVFLKPKDSGREEGKPQGTALPPADAEESTSQQAHSPLKKKTDGVTRGFPHSCWGQQEYRSLYFLFCSFVCYSADPKDQPATL